MVYQMQQFTWRNKKITYQHTKVKSKCKAIPVVADRVVRFQGPHTVYTVGSEMVVRLSAFEPAMPYLPKYVLVLISLKD
jgi:hypothetical protein